VALLPMGFAVPPALPRARWALTPPFHPYRSWLACPLRERRVRAGGLFSVALSSALPPPGVTRHRTLWSSDFPPASALARLRPALATRGITKRDLSPANFSCTQDPCHLEGEVLSRPCLPTGCKTPGQLLKTTKPNQRPPVTPIPQPLGYF